MDLDGFAPFMRNAHTVLLKTQISLAALIAHSRTRH